MQRQPFLLVAFLLFSTAPVRADWPAFLGGQLRGESASFQPPTQWSTDQGILWQTDLDGHGQSSPIVVDQKVYVTSIDGPMKETNRVVCFDLATGKELWRHESPSSLQAKNDVYASRAAPTPAADKTGVFAFFESGNLIALGPEGNVRWQRDFLSDYGKLEGRFGLGGSLAQLDDRIVVLADNEGAAYIAAINKQTGETIWKSDRSSRTAWTSPMIVTVQGQPHIVVSSAGTVDGYDPGSGKLLWTYDEVGGNTVASPVPVGDGMFLVGASPGRNGESSEGAARSNLLMRIEKTDDGYQPKVVWINEKVTSSFGSPIAHQGHAYFTNRAGVVFCLDLETGETAYTARMAESNWATPIGVGENLFFFGKDGVTTVLKAGGEHTEIAENQLWESSGGGGAGGFGGEIQYGVAALPDGFVIRTGSRLYRIK